MMILKGLNGWLCLKLPIPAMSEGASPPGRDKDTVYYLGLL
jgi:hypothetical protein